MMFFWGMHCHGRFDISTICYALDRSADVVQTELAALVNSGIVDRGVECGVPVYSLTGNEERRRAIVERVSPGHSGA